MPSGWLRSIMILLSTMSCMVASGVVLAQQDSPTLAGAGGASGIGQYPPLQWGVVGTTVRNPTDADQNLRVTLSFDDSRNLEFAADIWVPANSRRRVWLPIRTNDFQIDPYKTNTLKLTQRLFDISGEAPQPLHQLTGLLIASRDRFITGMLADGEEADQSSVHAALAARQSMEYSRRMAYLRENDLPNLAAGWRGLNSLVLSKNQPGLDSSQLAALRQWLLSGGRLWVMAEQVESEFMQRLLGDAWTVQVIDHVPLSRVRFDRDDRDTKNAMSLDDDGNLFLNDEKVGRLQGPKASWQPVFNKLNDQLQPLLPKGTYRSRPPIVLQVSGAATGEMAIETVRAIGGVEVMLDREHEKPVDMARVFVPDMEVMARVNGWPAAMRKRVGDGWLMVTTVGPRAWMEPVWTKQINVDGTERKTKSGQTKLQRGHAATRSLESLASWFFRDERIEPLPSEALEPFVSEQIGREIVGRGAVGLVLGAFVLIILVGGVWLAKRGRLEWIVGVGATGALLATVVLLMLGRAKRAAVPSTVAQAQFIQIAPGQQHAVVNGAVQIYNPGLGDEASQSGDGENAGKPLNADNAHIEATAGGLVLPGNLDELGSRRVSMVWTDLDRWHWQNVTLPSGQSRTATFEHATPLDQKVSAIASFDERGLVVRLQSGELGALESAMIATPTGNLGLQTSDGKTFNASPADVLPKGQYLSSGVLDQTQQQRHDIFRQLLEPVQSNLTNPSSAASKGEKTPGKKESNGRSKGQRRTGRSTLSGTINYPRQPTFLAWSELMPLGFEWPATQQKSGSALVAIPIQYERPAVGSRVTIPSPMMDFEALRGRGSISPYDRTRREWIALTTGGTARLLFAPPAVLRPMRLEGGTFKLDITAPQRAVNIQGFSNGSQVTLRTMQGANGAIEVDLPATIQPDAQGRIMIELTVGDSQSDSQSTWRINGVSLELEATIESEGD